jgi:hypothetical protein
MPHLLSHVADACFAAVSVVVGIGLLHWLEGKGMLNIKLYETRMLGSIVIFCGNPTLPSPRLFLVCTACAFLGREKNADQRPRIMAGLPKLGQQVQCNGIVMDPYAHPHHMNIVKHLVYA